MTHRLAEDAMRDALTHLRVVQAYAAERDLADQLTVDGICMRLSAGIEALGSMDRVARDLFFGTTWPAMGGMRTRIAHGYLLVSPEIVRATVERDLPEMIQLIEAALAQHPPSS